MTHFFFAISSCSSLKVRVFEMTEMDGWDNFGGLPRRAGVPRCAGLVTVRVGTAADGFKLEYFLRQD